MKLKRFAEKKSFIKIFKKVFTKGSIKINALQKHIPKVPIT